jgi:hypothetical protein
MSVKVMGEVFQHSKATLGARLVLLAIADCVDEETRSGWPSVPRIARKARLDERNVQRGIRTLVKLGELQVHARTFQSNVYLIPPYMGDAGATGGDTPPPADRHPPGGDTYTPLVALAPPRTVIEPSMNHERGRRALKCSWPPDFSLTPERAEVARRLGEDATVEWNKFKDDALEDNVQHVDWDASWRMWLRRAPEFRRRKQWGS